MGEPNAGPCLIEGGLQVDARGTVGFVNPRIDKAEMPAVAETGFRVRTATSLTIGEWENRKFRRWQLASHGALKAKCWKALHINR